MVNKKEDHFFERLFRQEYNSLLDEIEKIKINSIPKERKEKIIKILADYKKNVPMSYERKSKLSAIIEYHDLFGSSDVDFWYITTLLDTYIIQDKDFQ